MDFFNKYKIKLHYNDINVLFNDMVTFIIQYFMTIRERTFVYFNKML